MWTPLTKSGARERALEGLLRIGVAGCFIGHGVFGIIGKSAWLPYFAVLGIGEELAWILMPVVGTIDVLVGISSLLSPRPVVLAYGVFWATWTALLRPLAGESVFETLERAGNYGVPLALLLMAAIRFDWSRPWLRPIAIERLSPGRNRLLLRVLQLTTATLLIGHGGLALGAKPLLVAHLEAIGLPAGAAPVLGACELALAVAVLARPLPSLLLFVLAWKVSTEALFPLTGAPIWEFVERAGSYIAPLALWTLVTRPVREPSGQPTLTGGAVAGGAIIALLVAAAAPAQAGVGGAAVAGPEVLGALRGGGHVLACRHGITDRSRGDARRVDFDDPATQRVLSAEGRRQAERIGAEIRGLSVPIREVLASPYARTAETARLAFGRYEVRDALRSRRPREEPDLAPLFNARPPEGANRVLVTHQWLLYPMLPDVEPGSIREGDCVVVRPDGSGGHASVGRLGLAEWRALAATAERRGGTGRGGTAAQLLDPASTLAAASRGSQEDPALTAATRGGVSMVCRHAMTERFSEVEPVNYDDPSTQRLLSDEGERQSTRMGRAMRVRGVRVSQLVASPMRRAVRTAELMFPDRTVAIEAIWHTNGGSYGGEPLERRRASLSSPVAEGTRVIVSHIGTIASAIPEARERMGEGDCVVVRPGGDGYEVVGFIPWEAWERDDGRSGSALAERLTRLPNGRTRRCRALLTPSGARGWGRPGWSDAPE